MRFFDPDLEKYMEDHSSPETEILHELNRQTHLQKIQPQMLSGHLQGIGLKMFSNMLRPKRIIEIGTFTGYSAICLADGLAPEGRLHTIDIDEELKPMAEQFFQKAGVHEKITMHIGSALDIIPNLDETWDMAFIDADKDNYPAYYDLLMPRLRIGGFILADNVLWSGKVIDDSDTDKDTLGIRAFNEKVQSDPRTENVILSVRDGLMIARKISD
jgi:predicted O-methyltransferase YrrM